MNAVTLATGVTGAFHPFATSGTLTDACGSPASRVCREIYGLTHDVTLAKVGDALSVPIEILVILLVAFLVRIALLRVLARLVSRAANGAPLGRAVGTRTRQVLRDASPSMSARRQQRAKSIGSVLRSTVSIFVYGIAFIEILGVLGVNLAPIVASAGIVGVAVGFGAQNLVRDFISGVFMILEDQYGVGDVIDAGPATGTVEAISLRTTRVRDVRGVVWHIRNGEISRVGNMSQGWSRAVVDVPVSYRQSLPQAREVIKRVADEVWHDPDFAPLVLEEPEVWGVEEFGTDGLRVRLVVKTAPLQQWSVGRELRARLKEAFDREGLVIPLPQRTIWVHATGDGAHEPVDGQAGRR